MLRINRRRLLAGAAAGLGAGLLPTPAATEPVATLRAGPGQARLEGPDRPATDLWLFDGKCPGPLLRLRRGRPNIVRVVNDLEVATTVHWHGLRIDNAMDGVPDLTQAPIPPGGSFDYRLTPPDAGSFWYHSHYAGAVQVARGLYGPLIVEDDAPPPGLDHDVVLVLDDWRLDDASALDAASFGNLHDRAHAGRLGNVLTTNGRDREQLAVPAEAWVRLRLLNSANARPLPLALRGAPEAWIAAKDGIAVTPVALDPADPFVLWPASRLDLLVRTGAPGSEAALTFAGARETLTLAALTAGPRTGGGGKRPVLVAPSLPEPAPADALAARLVMAGGAMGGLASVEVDGQTLPLREAAQQHGYVWAMNGRAGMPEEPLLRVPRGRTVVLEMVNDTAFDHAMHVHGHHFRTIAWSREPALAGAWHDVVAVDRGQRTTVAWVADNPGKWLIHCHMLEHMEGGMVTWFEVT